MINPVTVMKLLNERKEFLEDNPELYPFVKRWFGNRMKKGTVIEIKIIPPKCREDETAENEKALKTEGAFKEEPEKEKSLRIEVTDPETGFFKALEQLFH